MERLVTRPGQIDQALVNKYSGNGPRYTSYPTAPQFSEEFAVDPYIADQTATRLRDVDSLRAAGRDALSIYVHVPFCRDICYYCACNKVITRKPGAARRYLDALRQEIELQAQLHGDHRPVRQMHWGGGSPTYLDQAEMTELMHELASNFSLLDKGYREYSIELDPRTVAEGGIALLKGLGFNRVSLGIQDFDPLVQKSVNRIQPLGMVRKLVEQVRHFGFRSMSFDLIYGLPHQDRFTMEATLDKVIALRPDRIACYNYAHLPERFSSQRAIDRLSLPTAAEKLALQEQIAGQLQTAGYLHIGLDHYVLPDDDLAIAQQRGDLQRNFQGYSVSMAQDLVGLGVSSISQVGDYYVQNARTLDDYYALLAQGQLPVQRGYQISTEDKLRRHVIMALICNLQLDTSECKIPDEGDFWQHFASETVQLRQLQSDGLLEIDAGMLRVTERGRPFLRNICMVFDQHLAPSPGAANAPRYSATV
ncbi:MAG: oxygen-independent coproporphyrinogen III oxidase [Halieaceae bacterium]